MQALVSCAYRNTCGAQDEWKEREGTQLRYKLGRQLSHLARTLLAETARGLTFAGCAPEALGSAV
jgi:hypothetical protein